MKIQRIQIACGVFLVLFILYKLRYDECKSISKKKIENLEMELEKAKSSTSEDKEKLEEAHQLFDELQSQTYDLERKISAMEVEDFYYEQHDIVNEVVNIQSLSEDGFSKTD